MRQFENLKAKMRGFNLNIYQEADALREFNDLLDTYNEMYEALEMLKTGNTLYDIMLSDVPGEGQKKVDKINTALKKVKGEQQ